MFWKKPDLEIVLVNGEMVRFMYKSQTLWYLPNYCTDISEP